VRPLLPRKITRNDTTHLSPHIRNSGSNNQQKAHIKVKISKAIIYQHETSKHWRSGGLLQGRRLSKHHSCERNSWLDCKAYLFELRRNEGKWENLFRILFFHAAHHNMKSMDGREIERSWSFFLSDPISSMGWMDIMRGSRRHLQCNAFMMKLLVF